MTPKEKALELFDKFNNPDRTNYPYVHNAQQCALIAVDEIINNWKSEATIQYPYGLVINYWNKVKQEIETL
jgi:hypothetical protein